MKSRSISICYSLVLIGATATATTTATTTVTTAFAPHMYDARTQHIQISTTSPSTSTSTSPSPSSLLILNESQSPVEEYKNAATSILSNFMQEKDNMNNNNDNDDDDSTPKKIDPLAPFGIDFSAPKFQKVPLQTMAQILDYELYNKEWFVTGNVNPIYFTDSFEFQDPDVKLLGIENYAKGVNKLFDQDVSRAEIIRVDVAKDKDGNDSVNDNDNDNDKNPDTITVTWRLSGKVKIGNGLTIKPYICYTDFRIDAESGLIDFQEDRFDIPQWDILVSALFPFLIGKVTKPPAPPVEREDIPTMPRVKGVGSSSTGGVLDSIFGLFNN